MSLNGSREAGGKVLEPSEGKQMTCSGTKDQVFSLISEGAELKFTGACLTPLPLSLFRVRILLLSQETKSIFGILACPVDVQVQPRQSPSNPVSPSPVSRVHQVDCCGKGRGDPQTKQVWEENPPRLVDQSQLWRLCPNAVWRSRDMEAPDLPA